MCNQQCGTYYYQCWNGQPTTMLPVAPGTLCYAAALDTYGEGFTGSLSYASALLVHVDDVHCLPRETVVCGPADQDVLQCFYRPGWNQTTKPCGNQFYTCSAGVPSQVRTLV